MYSRSIWIIASELILFRPETCQSPVIPGSTACRFLWTALSIWASAGSSGRGPTKDISPRRTFRSCGSSSTLKTRKIRPRGVTLRSKSSRKRLVLGFGSAAEVSSRRKACLWASSSFSFGKLYIVLNLNMVNGRPPRPILICRKRIGPALVVLIRIAVTRNSGDTAIRAAPAKTISRSFFHAGMGTSRCPPKPACFGINRAVIVIPTPCAYVCARNSTRFPVSLCWSVVPLKICLSAPATRSICPSERCGYIGNDRISSAARSVIGSWTSAMLNAGCL